MKGQGVRRLLVALCAAMGALIGAGVAATVAAAWEALAADGAASSPAHSAILALYALLGGAGALSCALLSGPILRVAQRYVRRAERALCSAPVQQVVCAVAGLIAGLIVALLTTQLLRTGQPRELFTALTALVYVVMGYLGASFGARRYKEWPLLSALVARMQERAAPREAATGARPKLLDTSAIIDGRICDICGTGFVEGTLVVPQFVLSELRHIADSGDALRRARGRRGLDVLSQLQKLPGVRVEITDADVPDAQEVDVKLLRLAQRMGGVVVTTDYNLNKVASLSGMRVLNVNELAGALRPAVLPGEELTVHVVREGKEPGQGVGYMDDGTMIVVENGRRHVGETQAVTVTTVLQTSAGRMIFARRKGERAG